MPASVEKALVSSIEKLLDQESHGHKPSDDGLLPLRVTILIDIILNTEVTALLEEVCQPR
jgi:hypothetical protein